jgi:drug/metabolite transporter (DMT)-like permease
MTILACLFGCLAAVANASTNVMQRAASRAESQKLEFSLQLIKNLMRRRLWLAGVGTMLISFLLQAMGLGFGTLAAVEPLLVFELPLTLLGARLFLGSALGRREWAAIAAMSAGTAGLIGFLGPSGGTSGNIAWPAWLLAGLTTGLVVGLAYWYGRMSASPARRAAVLGTGAGLAFGLAASFIKGMTGQFASGGIAGAITAWQLYAAGAAGIMAFWMNQNAINAGRLAVAQPGITLADPFVSIVWGALVFQEAMRGGYWLIAVLASVAAMTAGSIVLARSPSMGGDRGATEEGARRPEPEPAREAAA